MAESARILVIMDDDTLRDAVASVLNTADNEVIEVSTVQHGLTLARECPPDLILLDPALHNRDGLAACGEIKSDPRLANTLVMAMSGADTPTTLLAKALEVGADLCIGQSWRKHGLRAQIEAALRLQRIVGDLRETQERFRGITEASPVPIFLLDLEGYVQLWNRAAADLFGWTAEEVIGRPLPIVPPEYQAEFAALRGRVAKGEQLQGIELRRYTKNGTAVELLLSAAPVCDAKGKPVGIMSVMQDITERRALEAALRQEQELSAEIMEASPAGIIVVNVDGEITFANAAAERVLGLKRSEIASRRYNDPAWQITDLQGNPLPEADIPFRQIMNTRQPVRNMRHAIVWPDGTRVLLSISGTPIPDDAGEIERVVLTVTNITEHVQNTERMRRLNDALRAIRDLNQLLARVKDADALINEACQVLARSDVYDNAWITTLGPDGSPDRIAYAGERLREEILDAPLPEGLLQQCLEAILSRESICISNGCRLSVEGCPLRVTGGQTIVMGVALEHQATAYGVLSVGVNSAFADDPEAVRLLQEMAGDIAFALHNIRTEAVLANQIEADQQFQVRLEALVVVSNTLALCRSVDDLCHEAVRLSREQLGFDRVGVWLLDEDNPKQLRGTFGIDEQGKIRDERTCTVPVDPWLETWITRGHPTIKYEEQAQLHNHLRREVGSGEWARAMIWYGDAFAGTVSVDNLLSGAPISQHDRHLLHLFASVLGNLLARTRAEELLREREQFYRTIFETTGAATMVLREDMTFLRVNQETERLLGYAREELQDKLTFDTFVVPEDRDMVVSRHHGRRREPDRVPTHYQFRIQDRSGRTKDVGVWVRLIPGTTQSIASVVDITEQRAALQRVERQAALQAAVGRIGMHTTAAIGLETLVRDVLEETLAALRLEMGGCWCDDTQFVQHLAPAVIDTLIAEWPVQGDGSREEAQATVVRIDDTGAGGAAPAAVAELLRELGIGAVAGVINVRPSPHASRTGLLVAEAQPRQWQDEDIRLLETAGWLLSGASARLGLLQQLEREAERLQHVIDSVPEGVILLDSHGTVVLANPTAEGDLSFLADASVGDQIQQLGSRRLETLYEPPPEAAGTKSPTVGDSSRPLPNPSPLTMSLTDGSS